MKLFRASQSSVTVRSLFYLHQSSQSLKQMFWFFFGTQLGTRRRWSCYPCEKYTNGRRFQSDYLKFNLLRILWVLIISDEKLTNKSCACWTFLNTDHVDAWLITRTEEHWMIRRSYKKGSSKYMYKRPRDQCRDRHLHIARPVCARVNWM